MIEYRRIRIADVGTLVEFALAAIPDQPTLKISIEKVRAMVHFFATEHGHFQLAAFQDGKCVAGLAAVVTQMPFHEKAEATICFCFSIVPGAGFRLLRALMTFVRDHLLVRRLIWPMNPGFEPRIVNLANRLGFQSAAPMLIYQKGGA